jgi:hypothetical protein
MWYFIMKMTLTFHKIVLQLSGATRSSRARQILFTSTLSSLICDTLKNYVEFNIIDALQSLFELHVQSLFVLLDVSVTSK